MSKHESQNRPIIYDNEREPTYEEVLDEIINSPPIGEPLNNVESAREPVRLNNLQLAIKGRDFKDLLPNLSEDDKKILAARYNLDSTESHSTLRDAAKALGMSYGKLRRAEQGILWQVSQEDQEFARRVRQ